MNESHFYLMFSTEKSLNLSIQCFWNYRDMMNWIKTEVINQSTKHPSTFSPNYIYTDRHFWIDIFFVDIFSGHLFFLREEDGIYINERECVELERKNEINSLFDVPIGKRKTGKKLYKSSLINQIWIYRFHWTLDNHLDFYPILIFYCLSNLFMIHNFNFIECRD